jgi:UDP-N-acetylglucosamine 2-epimerase
MKIVTIVGARPQFIKAAAVSPRLRARHHEVLVHTGQHYDDALSDAFFRELSLPRADVELGVRSGPHGSQTGRMLAGIEEVLLRATPDLVLVYGDTNSTLAGALAAAKLHVPVAHVEAGVRSFNRRMPEEINRVLVDRVSTVLLCPSERAAENLRAEGITSGVHVIGDVMADVLQDVNARIDASRLLERFSVPRGDYILATIHRAENTDEDARLAAIVRGFDAMGATVILPAHPRLRQALARIGYRAARHVRVIDPVGYADMLALVGNARAVVTDSGGLQKEAYWLAVPCITARDETEWLETVETGWNVLVGANTERLVAAATHPERPAHRPPLYGEGSAVRRLLEIIDSMAVPTPVSA